LTGAYFFALIALPLAAFFFGAADVGLFLPTILSTLAGARSLAPLAFISRYAFFSRSYLSFPTLEMS
jgi:hypothetical protein